MSRSFRVVIAGVLLGMLLVGAYGSPKQKEGATSAPAAAAAYVGRPATLTGWLTGANCFTTGHACSPDHVWKYHEAIGFGTPDGKFYFLASVPRDTLVSGFTKEAVVKGTFYDTASVVQVDGLKVASGTGWDLIYGSDFSDSPTNPGAATGASPMKGEMAKGSVLGFEGYISGVTCVFHGMTCAPDHIWSKGEYSGLVTEDGKFVNLIGLPENFIPANFTREFYIHGLYYPSFNTLLVHHVAKDEKGAPIWKNDAVLEMAKGMDM